MSLNKYRMIWNQTMRASRSLHQSLVGSGMYSMMEHRKILNALRSRNQQEEQGLLLEAEVVEVREQQQAELERSYTLAHRSQRSAHELVAKDVAKLEKIAKHPASRA